jgi:glycosyltransferase involved in cell wall biosynthesis
MNACGHPMISVVICTLGSSPRLRACVEGVLQQPCRNFEVIIVHNGTEQENLHSSLTGLPIHVIRVLQRGVCHARNCALAFAHGEIIVFLDDDISTCTDWLHAMVTPFADLSTGAVCGLTKPVGEPYQALERYTSERSLAQWSVSRTESDWVRRALSSDVGFGCNMAFRRSFLETCPFPEDLGAGSLIGSGDEYYMFLQVLRRGKALCHNPAAIVSHYFDEEEHTIERRVRALIAGSVAFHLKLLLEMPDVRLQLTLELLGRMRRAFGWGSPRHSIPPRWARLGIWKKCRIVWHGIQLYLDSRRIQRTGDLMVGAASIGH